MSMKPLDLQTLLPKSTEIAKSRHLEQQRPETAQQQFALETRRQAVAQQRTVRRAESARGSKVNQDGRRGGSGGSSQSQGQTGSRKTADANRQMPAAERDSRSELDGKGKFIDIVLGSMGSWGNR